MGGYRAKAALSSGRRPFSAGFGPGLGPSLSYLKHTLIGDPLADGAVTALARLPSDAANQLLGTAINHGPDAIPHAPTELTDLFRSLPDHHSPPFDPSDARAAYRAFHTQSDLFISAFVSATLRNASTLIAKSFYATGRVTSDQALTRIRRNTHHLYEIMLPASLDRHGDGWKLSARIRLVHAQIRYLLQRSGQWDESTNGVPLSAAHLALASANFSATILRDASRMGANLESAEADVTRLRLGLEGSWPLALDDGAAVTPRLAIGLRHDGGDAETGFGADIGGGVTFEGPAQGLTISLEGRGVLTHEASGFRDRGLAGSLAWDPPPSNGRGPKLTLTQTVGAGASGGKDALLARTTLEGLAANDNGDDLGQRRLDLRAGYGLAMFGGGFTGTPEIGFGLSESASGSARDFSLGWRLTRAGSGPGSLEFLLEARRRESANDDVAPEHGIGFSATARW